MFHYFTRIKMSAAPVVNALQLVSRQVHYCQKMSMNYHVYSERQDGEDGEDMFLKNFDILI